MNAGKLVTFSLAALLALSSVAEDLQPPEREAQLHELNSTIRDSAPANVWSDAYPIGNGRFGAMVFGGVREERLQLNDVTVWSGGKDDPWKKDAWQHLPEIREAIERKEWRRALIKCVKATAPKSKSIVLISSRNIGLEDVMPAKERADDLHRRICFILKDPKLGSAENASLPKTFDIHELTPEECLSFLYKYAVKTGRLEEYAELRTYP